MGSSCLHLLAIFVKSDLTPACITDAHMSVFKTLNQQKNLENCTQTSKMQN